MGFLQVLAATVGGYALGAAYYMTLSKPWLAATGHLAPKCRSATRA